MKQTRLHPIDPRPVRILVTGARDWKETNKLEREILSEVASVLIGIHSFALHTKDTREYLEPAVTNGRVILVLGDCETGVDRMAHSFAKTCSIPFLFFAVGGGTEHMRNQAMANECDPREGDRFLAFWMGRERPSGTLDTVGRCVRRGVSGRIIAP